MFNSWITGLQHLFYMHRSLEDSLLTDVNSPDILLNHFLGPNMSVNYLYYAGDNDVHHQVIYVS